MIKNLPGWTWVYKGAKDPITGETATTRYGLELLSGKHATVRNVRKMQNEGIEYEKQVPPEKRKRYKRKTKNKKYLRYGPYYDTEAIKGNEDKIEGQGYLQIYGRLASGADSFKNGLIYRNVTPLMDIPDLIRNVERNDLAIPPKNNFENRIDHNIEQFDYIRFYYIYKKL